jgi:predicted ATP-dependent serine protease
MKFKTMTQIKRFNKEDYDYIKTGFGSLDKKTGGLIKGEVTIVSGTNGSGKSNILNQLCIEFAHQGLRTMLFSGEMPDYSVQNMFYNQMAGKYNLTKHKEFDLYYLNNEKLKNEIDLYLDSKVALYDNDNGAKVQDILDGIRRVVVGSKVDVIILDNLMTMDLNKYQGDKYDRQKEFILELTTLAKQLKVHILVVMHPRKVTGMLRKEDISGSADLSNAVDNVIIIHRVNNDFKARFKEMFKGTHNDLLEADTLLEVCKSRTSGIQDYFVSLYFTLESKTFNEEQKEKPYLILVK